MLEQLKGDFEQLVKLYTEVKGLVLDGEAQDEDQKCNIAVFNEMRAALDHVMQCIGGDLAEKPESLDFKKDQISQAARHIVRAGYDSLDGIGISIRKRISERMKGLSEISIAKSFPEYFSEYVPKIKKLDDDIRESRSNRNSNGNSKNNMTEYKAIVEEMKFIYAEIGLNLECIVNYDLLVSDNSEFKKEIKTFSQDAICKICPQYYSDYNNSIVELGEMLKQKTFKKEKERYKDLVEKISGMQDRMKNLFPELAQFDRKNKRHGIIYWTLTLVVAITAAIVGAIFF